MKRIVAWFGPRPARARESCVLIAAAALILALPALLNGRPFLFYDSEQYYIVGERMFAELASLFGAGGEPAAVVEPAGGESSGAEDGGLSSFYGGRSPFYGAFLVGLTLAFGMWSVVAVQAVLTAALITRALDLGLRARIPGAVLGVTAICALLSSAGYHAAFMMPDIFAGLGVLALICLLLGGKSRWEIASLSALICFAAASHTVTFVLLSVVVLAAAGLRFTALHWRPSRAAWAASVAALVAAFALNGAYGAVVERMTGEPLRAAPYLVARVIGDGPGARFLRDDCQGRAFAACGYATDDYVDHNDFLWGWAGAQRTFMAAPRPVQQAIQDEQTRFVLAVIAAYPMAQAQASFANAVTQFFKAGIAELDHGALRLAREPAFRDSAVMRAAPNTAHCRSDPSACPHAPPIAPAWQRLVASSNAFLQLAFAGLVVVWCFRRLGAADKAPDEADPLLAMAVLLLIALIANATLCGALSGPHDRYQARLAWLAPIMLAACAPLMRPFLRERRSA